MSGSENELNQYKDFEPSVQLLRRYLATPAEDRLVLRAALTLAAHFVPTEDDLYRARQSGSAAEFAIDSKYGRLADAYAKSIDGKFEPERIDLIPKPF